MREKNLQLRFEQVRLLAQMTPCSRRKFGALIINPKTSSVVSEGFNGTPRGAEGRLCGGDTCLRDTRNITSGCDVSIGCHHAEANAITIAARLGAATDGCWLVVNGEPCIACAKLIHHAGIRRVYCIDGGYSSSEGVEYLEQHGVDVVLRPGDTAATMLHCPPTNSPPAGSLCLQTHKHP